MHGIYIVLLLLAVSPVFSGTPSETASGIERTPSLFSMPAWQGLDTPDRNYESNVTCSFTPTITANAGNSILYPAVDAAGTIVGKLPKYQAYPTTRQALLENCSLCVNDLDHAKENLMQSRGARFMEERCYLRSCKTQNGRLVSVDADFFASVFSKASESKDKTNYCQFLHPRYHQPPAKNVVKAYNLYSRPNDDTFQNLSGPGGKGEPFEVAIVHCGLNAEKNKTTGAFDLSVDWRAELTTGRHVEAGYHFLLREARCSMAGEIEVTTPGERKQQEKTVNISVFYPFKTNKDSSSQAKAGSVIGATLPIGSISEDGNYSGDLELRTIQSCHLVNQNANATGMMQSEGIPGPKEGIFQKIPWKLTIQEGQVVKADIKCERKNEKLRLVFSNYQPLDTTKPEHQNYVPQPPFAPCKKETVGGGDLAEAETEAERLGKKVGELIQKSGCLDCHGEGNADLFRFCDDGVSVRPKDDGPKILSMLLNGMPTRASGKPYPKGMEKALQNLRKEHAVCDLIQKWVEAN